MDMDWITHNAAALRRSEARALQLNQKLREVRQRFLKDPEYHARIYGASLPVKEVLIDAGFKEHDDYPERVWGAALDSVMITQAMFELEDEESRR